LSVTIGRGPGAQAKPRHLGDQVGMRRGRQRSRRGKSGVDFQHHAVAGFDESFDAAKRREHAVDGLHAVRAGDDAHLRPSGRQ
jgi:hypothetical protein